MKKFYTLAVAFGVVASAFAGTPQRRQVDTKIQKAVMPQKMEIPASLSANASAKAATFSNIEAMAGEWTLNFTGMLQGQTGPKSGTVNLEVVNVEQGLVSFRMGNFVIQATVDLSAGTFSIPNKQLLGTDDVGDVYFYLKSFDENNDLVPGASSAAAEVGTINGYTITFPKTDIWAVGDFNDEKPGYYFLSYNISMKNYANTDPDEGWIKVGDGTFVDGWMAAVLEMDPTQHAWTVNVQRNADNDKLFRLDQPYGDDRCPYKSEISGSRGYIVFDISDPTFVAVLTDVNSGATFQSLPFYNTNLEGYFLNMGFSKYEIIQGLKDDISTFSSYDEDTYTVNFLNCRYTFPGEEGCFIWDESTIQYNQGSFKFNSNPMNGIDDIAVEENAPVEYYNLQGVRIINPEKGQLVIKRQGSKTSKTIIR